jgi:hypothetical protein
VNDTEQLDVVAFRLETVHGVPMKAPLAVPVLVKATLPTGADAVPAVEESLTNVVQLVAWPTFTVDGEQTTLVEVPLKFTETMLAVPSLPLWTVSNGV